jgi:hypothetical protein
MKIKDSLEADITEGYNLLQQLTISAIICTLAFSSFLPFILKIDIYNDDPGIPYSGAADDVLIAVTNAVVVTCTLMMLLAVLLNAFTLYLPIKLAFPRFIMVVGVLVVTLSLYFQPLKGMDRLSFISCMLQANGYFICGGFMLKLFRDAYNAEQNGHKCCIHAAAAIVLIMDMQVHRWAAYYPKSTSFNIIQGCVSLCTLSVGLYLVFRVVQLSLFKGPDDSGHRSYDLMSHLVVCVYGFGTYGVSLYYGSNRWKDCSAEELAAYHFVCLSAMVLFFFTSSYVAQRAFVLAKVST